MLILNVKLRYYVMFVYMIVCSYVYVCMYRVCMVELLYILPVVHIIVKVHCCVSVAKKTNDTHKCVTYRNHSRVLVKPTGVLV